ncbi:O-antigen ligase family protein [Pseudomonas putida]|uniref:O-antigen ligase family protein n=1 Tax=Pseudomonas putida TaxID=303 RepID=UPI002D77620F|nr:O-antigen ligase family protein [Pseudomonas putida]
MGFLYVGNRALLVLVFGFWFLIFGVLCVYVLLTYTRGAWIALAFSSLVVVLLRRTRRAWFVLSLAGTLLIVAIYLFWDALIFEVTTRQLSGRGPIWNYFFSQMPGYWLFGHGLGTEFKYVWPGREMISPHAHSLYLQQIYDSGLISVALLLLGLATLTYKSVICRRDPWVQLAFPALLFAVVAMFTDVERIFTRPGDYWTVLWLPVAIILAVSHKVSRKAHPE